MKFAARTYCSPERIRDYLDKNLSSDEELDFLLHLDECQLCRDTLYEIMKGSHEDYYRKVSGKRMKKELKEIARLVKDETEEEMTDVA